MNGPREINSLEKWGKYILAALFLITAFLVAANFDIQEVKEFLQQYEKFGAVACLCLYVLLGITPVPSDPVTFLVLAWKGPVVAIALATLGNTLSAIIEYYIGGGINSMTDFEKKKEKLPFHLGQMPIDSPVFLLTARMLPGFGPKFVSIAGGMYQVPMFTYCWTALVSNLLGAAVIVLGGYGIIQLFW